MSRIDYLSSESRVFLEESANIVFCFGQVHTGDFGVVLFKISASNVITSW